MAVNIKFNEAVAVARNVLAKPINERHGITGFWDASLRHVQNEGIIRLADMPNRRFILEAEIDPAATHKMSPARMEEYIDHQLLKKQIQLDQ